MPRPKLKRKYEGNCIECDQPFTKIENGSPSIHEYPVCFKDREARRKLEYEGHIPRSINGRIDLNA